MSNNNNERRELTAAELDLVTGGAGFDAFLEIIGVTGGAGRPASQRRDLFGTSSGSVGF
jgi:hypothetical protein